MDKVDLLNRNVLMRIVKPYPEARNHIYSGRVQEYDGRFICIDGYVLHFARASADDPSGGLTTSARGKRWVALERVEYIRELPEGIDPFNPEGVQVSADGSVTYDALHRPDLIPD